MANYPDLEILLSMETQDEYLLRIRRSWYSIFSNFSLFFILLIAASTLNVLFSQVENLQHIALLQLLGSKWVFIIPAIALLEAVRRYHDDIYLIGEHQIKHLRGRLSLSYSVPIVRHVDIRAININQDVFGRIFNYGTVEIGTSAQKGSEMHLAGVRWPRELAALLENLRCHSVACGEYSAPA